MTLDELKRRFDQMQNVLVDLNICMNNAERLVQNKYAHEESLKGHGFWIHHFAQLKFILIIQLCKLLSSSNNQKISFIKLLSRLEDEKYDEEFSVILESNKKFYGRLYQSPKDVTDDVDAIKTELETKKALITKVVTVRDKVYAHYDPDSHVERITFTELRELVDFASQLFNRIRGKLLNVNVYFSHTRDWDVDYIIKELNDNKQTKLDNIQTKLTKE